MSDGNCDDLFDGNNITINNDYGCHTLKRTNENYYFCNNCNKSYATIDDFFDSHQNDRKNEDLEFIAEPGSVDDLIEYDETEDDQEIKTEIGADFEATNDKYFCYDCRTVFFYRAAEEHNCLGIKEPIAEQTESYEQPNPIIDLPMNKVVEIICEICNTKFASVKSLKLHVKMHEQTVISKVTDYNRLDHFFCEICDKSFETNLLAVHKKMHQHSNEDLICNSCNRHFDSPKTYEVHKQLHFGVGAGCDSSTVNAIKTGKTQAALRNARNGIKSKNNGKLPPPPGYPCTFCGHVFYRPYEKVRHERIHTGEKPYSCEICGKRFRVPYSLTLHLRTHTELRPFVCSTCNKRFKSHSVYTHHLRTHIKERSFSCDLCNKSFRTSVQLHSHKNSHIKPFNCPDTICNRPFASLSAVKTHLKSHDKSKNSNIHNCSICGAVYGRASALRAHIKDHDAESSIENYYEELSKECGNDESNDTKTEEVDPVSMLLINAAAEAEANREASISFQFDDECQNDVDDDSLVVNRDYLRNEELTLDNFDTEETVITGF